MRKKKKRKQNNGTQYPKNNKNLFFIRKHRKCRVPAVFPDARIVFLRNYLIESINNVEKNV